MCMRIKLQNLQRIYKQLTMLFVDVIVLVFALWLAFVLKHGAINPVEHIDKAGGWWIFITIPVVMIPLFVKLGL